MSEEPPPLITIVTPCLNRRDTIAESVESVLAQGVAPVEHIVTDGGSTDGTLDILARYPDLRVVSEPDRGLYDAINKGIRLARGGIVGLLNSDDVYAPGALQAAVAALSADPSLDMVCGGVEVFADVEDGTTKVLSRVNSARVKRLRETDIVSGLPLTNGRFFRRTVFHRIGEFDLRFPVAADRDFLLRALLAGLRIGILPDIVYRYRSHPGSLTFGGEAGRERYLREYLGVATVRSREEPPGSPAWRAYRRWRAWAAGYLALYLASRRHLAEAAAIVAATFRDDALWVGRFLRQGAAHLRERGLRRWSET